MAGMDRPAAAPAARFLKAARERAAPTGEDRAGFGAPENLLA